MGTKNLTKSEILLSEEMGEKGRRRRFVKSFSVVSDCRSRNSWVFFAYLIWYCWRNTFSLFSRECIKAKIRGSLFLFRFLFSRECPFYVG